MLGIYFKCYAFFYLGRRIYWRAGLSRGKEGWGLMALRFISNISHKAGVGLVAADYAAFRTSGGIGAPIASAVARRSSIS